jgi:hypothetical protein
MYTAKAAANYAVLNLATSDPAAPMRVWGEAMQAEQVAQAALLRDIAGNPFGPPPRIDPAWLKWHDGTVLRLATGIYEQRAFERMPLLADMLLDVACDDEALLGHLRGGGPHALGCHALDALLGKG